MAGTFRFLEEIALADIAFEAEGESVEEVFRGATQAEARAAPKGRDCADVAVEMANLLRAVDRRQK